MIPLAEMLAPVSAELPCGLPPMEDPDAFNQLAPLRQEFEQLTNPVFSMVSGTADQPLASPNERWRDLQEGSAKLFRKTKDLELAWYVCMAEVKVEGIRGLADSLNLLYQLVDRFWENIHPLPVEEGEGKLDHSDRTAWLASITSHRFLKAIKDSPITKSRVKNFSIGEAITAKSTQVELPDLNDAAEETRNSEPEFYDEIGRLLQESKTALTQLAESVDAKSGEHLDVTTLSRELRSIGHIIEPYTQVVLEDDEAGEGENGSDGGGGSAGTEVRSIIESREDVVDMLERICQHYQKTEPTSPVPYMLQRVKRVVTMNFVEIVGEFKLEGTPAIEDVIGKFEEEAADPNSAPPE